MKLKEYLKKQLKRDIEHGPKNDIVLSTRVRLARNLDSKPFPWRANNAVLEKIWDKTKETLIKYKELGNMEMFDLQNLDAVDKEMLIERHISSYNHIISKKPRGVVVTSDEKISIMVNEEDHFRLTSIYPGMDLNTAAAIIDAVDNKLSQDMGFAFSDEWGFLTACPTNAGTGMRASCLVHLPALILTEKIEPMLRELSRMGVVVRGLYGEHTEVLGDIFQITNGSTMGRSELEILQGLEHVLTGIIAYEKSARQELLNAKNRISSEDKIYRAQAILSSTRSISFPEAMSVVSKVKLGINLGLDMLWSQDKIDRIMVLMQPAHLQMLMGKELSVDEIDIVRARIIRQKLN